MSMILKSILLFTLLVLACDQTFAQVPTQNEVSQELEKRGIDENELRVELLKRGVDIDNIDASNPNELLANQKIIEEVIAELEAKKAKNISNSKNSENSKTSAATKKDTSKVNIIGAEAEIKDAVEDGATLDEAISEELQERAKLKVQEAEIYGQHLFRDNSVKFYRKSEDAKPPPTYIIGPGDVINIAIWGSSEANFASEVNRDGFIKLDRIPRIYLSGLSITQAKELIKSKLSRNYRFTDGTFEVNVSTARTINVNITGEVFNVGSYNISALNTAFNALVAANGPSDIGSVRNIKVSRAGGSTRTLDIYKFQQNPLTNEDFYLQDNDYIVVPVAEKIVQIKGAVNRPFKYELLENEGLNELVKYAGGLRANALKRNIDITRIEDDEKVFLNVNLNELSKSKSNYNLQNGDIIEISYLEENIENIVTVNGSVEVPGEYSFEKGMRISNLLAKSKVKDDAILSLAYLMRLNPDKKTVRYQQVNIDDVLRNTNSPNNILLQEGDILTIRARSTFVDSKSIVVEGAVRIEGTYLFNGGTLKVSDAIFLSGGLQETATDFAFIFREKNGNASSEYININLSEALSDPSSQANVSLLPGDKLIVYNRNAYIDESYVQVSGAVRNTSEIKYDESLTVKKALLLAGGLTFDASSQQIDIFRLDFSNNKKTKTLVANVSIDEQYNLIGSDGEFKLQPFDQIFVRQAPEFELQRNVQIIGEVKYPGSYALISENAKISELIRQAGGATEEAFLKGSSLFRAKDEVGYIIVDVEDAVKKPNSSFNAILQEGDILRIPKRNNLVTVTGAVLAKKAFIDEIADTGKFNFVFEKGKNAKYYVDKYAGGVAKNGKASRISVTYPNGEVRNTTKFLFFNNYPAVEPGSIIHVGYKDVKDKTKDGEKSETDWGKVLSDSVAQATTILTLVILINNLD